MTTAVTIKNVDTALLLRYSGVSIDVDGTPTAVEVFIEEPQVEEYPERVYPSVSVKLIDIEPDYARSHSDDDEKEEVGYDDAVSPPVRTMRLRPHPFRLTYSIDTWHKDRAGESRDLLKAILIERTPPRGAMSVEDVDGGTEACWVQWLGSMVGNDEAAEDYVIYHKTLTVQVLVDLLTDTSTEDVKVVTEAIWRTYAQSYKLASDGREIEIIPGGDVLFQGMRVTETDVGEE